MDNGIKSIPKKIKSQCFIGGETTDVVKFQALGVDINAGKIGAKNVPSQDYVYDSETGKTYEITFNPRERSDQNGEKVIVTEDIWFEPSSAGMIFCNLKTKKGRELYEFLCLSNYNESNPYRDPSKRAKFKIIDDVREAEKTIEDDKAITLLKTEIYEMTDKKLKDLADWLGEDGARATAPLRASLIKEATERGGKVRDAINTIDREGDTLLDVVRAQKHGIIKVHRNAGQWVWCKTSKFLMSYDLEKDHSQNVVRLARYFKDDDGSGEKYNTLLDELKPHLERYKF